SQCRIVLKREFDSPVVRQIEFAPVSVVKRECSRRHEIARLLEATGEAKIFIGIAGMTKMEPPAEIEQQALSPDTLHVLDVCAAQRSCRRLFGDCGRSLKSKRQR